jgi:hypothetical protein
LRIRTTATRRAIDKWKERIGSEASRFYLTTAAIATSVLSVPNLGRALFAIVLVLGTLVNFALSELALLTLVGFLMAKLHFYRFVNLFLRFAPFTR